VTVADTLISSVKRFLAASHEPKQTDPGRRMVQQTVPVKARPDRRPHL